jgi:hypothetical protein
MPVRKKRESREQRRFTRNATKKGFVLRRPAHLGKILAAVLGSVGVVTLALLWGQHLKAESDAYRAALEADEWTLDAETAVPIPVEVPDIRAKAVYPGGNVGDILLEASHEGVIFSLTAPDGTLAYRSPLGEAAGMTAPADAMTLSEDVARVKRRGLRVVCAVTVTWQEAETAAQRLYRRGLELALLRECAEAGVDELLLLGLPSHEAALEQTVAFLRDLKDSLAELETPPAVGVALATEAFATERPGERPGDQSEGRRDDRLPLYAGNTATGHIRKACDYLAMDLREISPEGMAELLPRLQYIYVRYGLRLLTNAETPEAAAVADSHGFARVYEMNADLR